MKLDLLYLVRWNAHCAQFDRLEALAPAVAAAASTIAQCLAHGGKLLLCGNGGSAADCQHIAAELTGRFVHERPPLAAIALTTDSSALTCIGNDYGFEEVFARQVGALARSDDVLLAISTSGHSPNLLRAIDAARAAGAHTIALSGRDGGALAETADQAIVVPGETTATIQEAHIFIGHALCALVEHELELDGKTPPMGTD
jgi:D-sedoheptulose 7-phosphate isomerase